MTDSNTLAPTDDDLRALWQQHAPVVGGTLSFVRAVLAKWGTPAPASQPAAQAQEEAVAQAVAAEREACAQLAAQTVCDMHIPTGVKIYGTRAAKAIRARGTDAAKPAAKPAAQAAPAPRNHPMACRGRAGQPQP